jgi:uncharacterized protein (DUF1778 family)
MSLLSMIQLNLSPENQAALEQGAAAAGTDLTTFIWDAVKDRLKERARPTLANAPYEIWKREFDTFIAAQKSHNPDFDDSRESIYD